MMINHDLIKTCFVLVCQILEEPTLPWTDGRWRTEVNSVTMAMVTMNDGDDHDHDPDKEMMMIMTMLMISFSTCSVESEGRGGDDFQ